MNPMQQRKTNSPSANLDVLISRLRCEGSTVPKEIKDAFGDATVDAEDGLETQKKVKTRH
jgi:hypothetical protein